MHTRVSPVIWLTICAAVSACGGAMPAPDASSDGSSDAAVMMDASTSDAAVSEDVVDTDAQSCTTVVSGAAVTSTGMMAASPTPMGGAIADGDYQLASVTAYYATPNPPAPRTLEGAMRFRGTNVDLVLTERGSTLNTSGTYTTMDTSVSLTWSCPRMAPARGYPYTATATRFDWFLPPNLVLTFVRQ